MNVIDIREEVSTPVTAIRFANTDPQHYVADLMTQHRVGVDYKGVAVKDSDSARFLILRDREHADNLIKAIDQAKKLGWI